MNFNCIYAIYKWTLELPLQTTKVTLPGWTAGLIESIDFAGTVIRPQKTPFLAF